MTSNEQKSVQDVMEELSNEHYLGNIKAIAVVTINEHGEPELRMGMNTMFVYSMNMGFDLMKQNLLNDIIHNASGPINKKDI